MLRKLKTDTVMRSVAWSNDGKFLLIGCGGSSGGKRGKKDGAFLVIEVVSLDVKFEGRDSRHWIRDVKYERGRAKRAALGGASGRKGWRARAQNDRLGARTSFLSTLFFMHVR